MKIVVGNEIEVLFSFCKANLIEKRSQGLRERLIAPSSPGLGEWISEVQIADPELGFIFGQKVVSPQKALYSIVKKIYPSLYPVEKKWALNSDDLALWLYSRKANCSQEIILYEDVKKTARFFHFVAGLCKEEAELCIESFSEDLRALWDAAYGDKGAFLPLFELVEKIKKMPKKGKAQATDFIGLPLFTPLEWQLLRYVAQGEEIQFWLFSPSFHFWEDHISQREAAARGTEAFQDGPPLLASWGGAAKRAAHFMNEEGVELEECYQHSEQTREYVEEYLLPGVSFREGLGSDLEKVIAENLFFAALPPDTWNHDPSIQFHESPSPRRSIEILYDIFIQWIKEGEVAVSDILVITPRLDPYIPHIQAIFGKKESLLGYHIAEGESEEEAAAEKGLLDLLKLALGKWEKKTLFSLLQNEQISYAKKESKSSFSFIEFLRQFSLGPDFLSWELKCHILLQDSLHYHQEPLLNQENEGQLLRFLAWIREIERALSGWNSPKPLSNWISELQKKLTSFFNEPRHLDDLFCKLHDKEKLVESELSLSFFIYLLEEKIEKKKSQFLQKKSLGTPIFSSFSSYALVPAKAICVLGANDGIFPRIEPPLWIEGKKQRAAHFTRGEVDRLHYLQALFSARKFFVMVSEAPVSSLIDELRAHLGNPEVIRHPELREDSALPFFSYSHYESKIAIRDALAACVNEKELVPKDSYLLLDLEQVVRNPLSVYVRENYGIALPEKYSQQESPFSLSPKDLFVLRKKRVETTAALWGTIISRQDKIFELPVKPFWNLVASDLDQSDAATADIEEKEFELVVEGKSLFGVIQNRFKRTLPQSCTLANHIKNYPNFLFTWAALQRKPEWKFIDGAPFEVTAQTDPEDELVKLLYFYEKARRKPTPYLADWIEPILLHEAEAGSKRVHPLWNIVRIKLGVMWPEEAQEIDALYGCLLKGEEK